MLATALDTLDVKKAGHYAEFTEAGLGNTEARQIWRNLMSTETHRYVSQTRAEGRAEGRAESVLDVLRARKIEVTPAARERIFACEETEVLGRWLVRALEVESVEELFE